MSYILQIETSSKCCSAAISNGGQVIAHESLASDKYIHAESLHPMIQRILTQSQISAGNLSAVAISKGPGSYTGLRIGVSAAKGLCYALGTPLISIDTTEILANHGSYVKPGFSRYVPMIDARRMEVYAALFDQHSNRISSDESVILSASYFNQFSGHKVMFIGDGAFKCEGMTGADDIIINCQPDATMMSALVHKKHINKDFENVSTYEPFYLKDYIPGVSRKSAL